MYALKVMTGYAQSVQSVIFAICGSGEVLTIVKSVVRPVEEGERKSTSK